MRTHQLWGMMLIILGSGLGCTGKNAAVQKSRKGETNCTNAVDDDGDGKTDCDDPDCAVKCNGVKDTCTDGIDNDNDKLIDCDDHKGSVEGCLNHPACVDGGSAGSGGVGGSDGGVSGSGGLSGSGGTGGSNCASCSEVAKGADPATLCGASKALYASLATCTCENCPSNCSADFCQPPGSKAYTACSGGCETCVSELSACQSDLPSGTGGTGGGSSTCCGIAADQFVAGNGLPTSFPDPTCAQALSEVLSKCACAPGATCIAQCSIAWAGCSPTPPGQAAPKACLDCLSTCPAYIACLN